MWRGIPISSENAKLNKNKYRQSVSAVLLEELKMST